MLNHNPFHGYEYIFGIHKILKVNIGIKFDFVIFIGNI